MIEYKGYIGVFEYDESIDAFHGRVIGLRDVITFQGRSVDDLKREMKESVEDYLELCAEAGKDPDKPYRGEFIVRTSPEVHRKVATQAEASGVSMNTWVESVLTSALETQAAGSSRRGRAKPRTPSAKTKKPRRKRSDKQSV